MKGLTAMHSNLLQTATTIVNKVAVLLGVAVLVATPLQAALSTRLAAAANGWLSAANPELKSVDMTADYVVPYSYNYNTDCHTTNFSVITREAKPGQTELRYGNNCAVRTVRGMTDGVYLDAGTPAGKFTGVNGNLAMVPNSKTLLSFHTLINGVSLEASYYDAIVPTYKPSGEVEYAVTNHQFVTDQAGGKYFFRPGSIGYSNDGRWIVAETTRGYVRVDLQTRQVTPFAYPTSPQNDPGADQHVAISPDGRYAAVAVGTSFTIYDISTCAAVPAAPTGPVACQSRSIESFLKSKFSGFKLAYYIRFASPDFLTFLAAYTAPDGTVKKATVRMAPAGQEIPDTNYLALGDSFSSGEGAFSYIPGTDDRNNNCHVSRDSYPYLAAGTLAIHDFNNVACSAAATGDYFSNKQHDNTTGNVVFAGEDAQSALLTLANPNVITLSMGGNDIGFSDKIKRCMNSDSCFHFLEDRETIASEIQAKFELLTNLYQDIRSKAPNTKIYVLGYPNLFSTGTACDDNVRLDAEERALSQGLVGYLNATIRAATEKAGVQYIDVENAFDGHMLCDTGQKAVNGLTAGTDILLFGNESFHPNALGHQLMSQALLAQSNNFTKAMPSAQPNKTVPTQGSVAYTVLMGNAVLGGHVRKAAYYASEGADTLIKGQHVSPSTADVPLVPGAIYDIVFESDPTYAGSLQADIQGQLVGEVTVPMSLPAGIHTMHIYGKNLAGQDIDIYKVLYIAASETDIDGDGIPNNQEKCLIVEPSNVDHDRDGIDDACDGEIGEPPTDSTPPTVTGIADRQPDSDSWYNHSATIDWNAVDPQPSSGAPSQPAPTVADQEGENTYTSAPSCDPAGNCATGSLIAKLDKTIPVLSLAQSPLPNPSGWNNTDVTITPTCTDMLSSIKSCSAPVTLSSEGAGQMITSNATDKAGNTATASITVNIDKTAPTLGAPVWSVNPKPITGTASFTIPATDPLSGIEKAEYYLGDSDPGQGNGATMNISGGSLMTNFGQDFPTGVYKVTVRAKDRAGNWSTAVSDYLVVHNPEDTRKMTGKKTLLPSLANGDTLPGLISPTQEDKAKFGFNVRYDKQGQVHPNSDFQFEYQTGTKCNNPAKAQSCHDFQLNATSIAWYTTQGTNNSTGIFQGTATLNVDGATRQVQFRLTGLDGERLNTTSQDRLNLQIYQQSANPNTANPTYRVDAEVLRGNIRIRAE